MRTRTALLVMLGLLAIVLGYAAYHYPRLPVIVPVHWNLEGKSDGWGHKAIDLFLAPGVIALMILLTVALPALSPKNFKIEPFLGTYNSMMALVVGLFTYLHFVIVYAAGHPSIDIGRFLIGGMLIFFAA